MDMLFKNVEHVNEVIHGYELKDVLQVSEWDQKISSMFEHLDLAVLQKCWTSILYELPITIVMIGDKSDKDKVILDNFREVDALMSIYGFNPRREKLYLDPEDCELALENAEHFVVLEDVYDTVRMLQTIDAVKQWNMDEDAKNKVIDNIKHVNKKLQMAQILFHELLVRLFDRSRLASALNKFYKDL